MQAVRPEHILPATQTKCCGGALSDHACPAVDGLPAIEKTRHKDAIDPALQNCGYAEPEARERENDEIGCLDLEIGSARVGTTVTSARLVCRLRRERERKRTRLTSRHYLSACRSSTALTTTQTLV